MSERERESYFKGAVSRQPGKRQIKPSVALFEAAFEEASALSDEDDMDFTAHNESDQSSSDALSEDEGSAGGYESGSESEEDEAGEEGPQEKEGEQANEEGSYEVTLPPGKIKHHINGLIVDDDKDLQGIGQICSICLNLKPTEDCGELIQCDKCGIMVHEYCYTPSNESAGEANHADHQSMSSSASTEPWFCEPCLFGDGTIPHCELCPSRFGAFKKADVPGAWVHLICALFTPGIQFFDSLHQSDISWQDIDYRNFGRKTCLGCTDKLESRTGITVRCDAGFCKNHFHVTCAQRLGLLIQHDQNHQSNSHEAGYLYCKRHNHHDSVVARQKNNYNKFIRQEDLRMVQYKNVQLDSRQEKKWQTQVEGRLKQQNNFTNHPTQQKKAKFLHASTKYINAFAEKSELLGMTRQQFEEEFSVVPPSQLPVGLIPAFSKAFVGYANHRDEILITEDEKSLNEMQKLREKLLNTQTNLNEELMKVKARHNDSENQSNAQHEVFSKFKSIMLALSPSILDLVDNKKKIKIDRKRTLPKTTTGTENEEKQRKLNNAGNVHMTVEKQQSKNKIDTHSNEFCTSSIPLNGAKQVSNVYIQNPETIFTKFGLNDKQMKANPQALPSKPSPTHSKSILPSNSISPNPSIVPDISAKTEQSVGKKCNKCKKADNLHLLIFCETCKNNYHIGCLDPPLDRMPTKDKFSRFECSDCADEREQVQAKANVDGLDKDWALTTSRTRRGGARTKTQLCREY